jgi:hypothetical protein
VRLAGPRWAEEYDVVLGYDEVEGAQVGDDFAFEGALVVEVEFLDLSGVGVDGSAVAAGRDVADASVALAAI